MIKAFLSILIGFGSLLADTLVLRDGSEIAGTLVSASRRTVTFLDSRGDRRTYKVAEVEEIVFGASGDRSRTDDAAPSGTTVELINRLNSDIDGILSRSSLAAQPRRMLENARAVLGAAAEDLQDNRSVNSREVRKALSNVRYAINGAGVRAQDRREVLDDIQMLRSHNRDFGSSNRSR